VLLAKAAASSNHFTLYVALITGASALLGAAVGGIVSGKYTLKGEEKRQQFAREEAARRDQREAERERTAAQGAARVMAGEFKRALAMLESAKNARRIWLPHSIDRPPVEDRKLIASLLDGARWQRITTAELVVTTMLEHHTDLQTRFDQGGFDDEIERFLDLTISTMRSAIGALRPLTSEDADGPEAPVPPVPRA